jgi:hypothetical protein
MASLFEFRWAVDQDGYEIEHVPASTGPTLLEDVYDHDLIRPRGGPLRWYRPMDDHPGLWCRFAACSDASGLLEFVSEFGLLYSVEGADSRHRVDYILSTTELIRQITDLIRGEHYAEAAALWNQRARPHLTAGLVPRHRHGRFEFKPVPLTLVGALLLQTGEAIACNQQWRHCRNDGCPQWFRIGDGAPHTSRREFCSDRCRVAWARHHKQGKAINA